MDSFGQPSGLNERIYWLIKLRWIAIGGVFLTVFFVVNILGISLTALPLYGVAVFLTIYNFIFFVYLKRLSREKSANISTISNRIANTQISLDLLSLVILIHFSSGIENPFIFYFIFHMIIASIILSRRAAFLQASFAVSLFISFASLEYFGILPHYPLSGFAQGLYNNYLYVIAVCFVFATTLYIAVYMATNISLALRQREASLREANNLLKEKDQAKSEYVLRVTHDIKEHLAAVQGCIEPVTAEITGALNLQQKDLLGRATERTSKLLFFVKALLEISRIKLSQYFKMENIYFPELINNSVDYVEARAKKKDIKLEVHIDAAIKEISAIPAYLEETFSNLLANSVKYTPKGGRIDLGVFDKGDSILIEIKDTGIGIPAGELPHIFDEFYRASNAKEIEKDGTGLGLSIAKQVIEKHKGRIWVESEENKGSTFYIILPKRCNDK